MRMWRIGLTGTALAGLILPAAPAPYAAAAAAVAGPGNGAALSQAVHRLVRQPGGPPGIIVLVQRGRRQILVRAGTAQAGRRVPIRRPDSMRLASVAKAFSGAAALALVARGRLALSATAGGELPGLPRAWSKVTLRELLHHTSGIQDFSQTAAFRAALLRSPRTPPPPRMLLSFARKKLSFRPGSQYRYSNSDNIIVALMVQAVTGRPYAAALHRLVLAPLGLSATSLPRGAALPAPYVHGYALDPPRRPADVSHAFAAGWAWASGGVVSTPRDLSVFIRGYVRGALTSAAARRAQFRFRAGRSEPPGPGRNAAGLAIFRYQTRCGTVYGHTGNTAGYTQFAAASRSGRRSAVVSVNAQITPASSPARFGDLRRIYALAVCAAMS